MVPSRNFELSNFLYSLYKLVVFTIMWEGHAQHMPAVAVIDTFSSIQPYYSDCLSRTKLNSSEALLRFVRLRVSVYTRKIDFHVITRLLIAP